MFPSMMHPSTCDMHDVVVGHCLQPINGHPFSQDIQGVVFGETHL